MAPLIFLLTSDALAPLQLATEPIGWDAMKYLFVRDLKYHGVTLSVSAELTFVKQAAAYLRTVYEGGVDAQGGVVPAGGVEGLVTLTVYEQNPNELRPEEIYRGRIDFTSYESTERGVSCRCKESGFTTQLLTRMGTAVDLLGNESLSGVALPPHPPVTATLHSQQTLQRYEATQVATPDNYSQDTVTQSEIEGQSILWRTGFPNEKINEFDVPGGFGSYQGDRYSPVNTPFYTAKEIGLFTLDIAYQQEFRFVAPTTYRVTTRHELRVNRVAGAGEIHFLLGVESQDHYQGVGPSTYTDTIAPQSFALQLGIGDQVFLYTEITIGGLPTGTLTYSINVAARYLAGSYCRMRAVTTTRATTTPGLLVHEALSRCAEACTDQRYALYSDYFGHPAAQVPYAATGPGALRLLTSGFQLRGFPLPKGTADPQLTAVSDARKSMAISFEELYTGLDAIDCLGLGIETRNGRPVVRIEPRPYFYPATETLRLGAVTDLKKSVYPGLLYNEATAGYAHWQSGADNGLDEFNGLRTYALPLTQYKQAYTLVSKLNAAGYLIEATRRQRYIEGATKEGQADAEPFLIAVLPAVAGRYPAERGEYMVPGATLGILSPETAYNQRLSPGRMLFNHGPWLRAGLAAQTSKRLLLTKSEGNAHYVSQRIGDAAPLDEFAPVAVSDLPAPLVLAETYEFTARVRRGQMEQLRRAPYGRVSFLDSAGTRKSGYLLRAERTPQGGKTTFTLLRAAS